MVSQSPVTSSASTLSSRRSSLLVLHEKSYSCNSKTAAERRQARDRALERYRDKRTRRSFANRVKYTLRASAAQFKPRVRGRFVSKANMHLYLKYGDQYMDHIGEAE
mmetsp:Transcript_13203/g.28675  ORF Transcript_13203/g.28675 Transcript_13203/m.28675 type:complete len:107 (+) Transcript_13203:2-322(+)